GKGTLQADSVTSTVQRVKRAAEQVAVVVAEISTASDEQTAGIEEIHAAVNQMDRATQENAALVDETAAAALSLNEQARELRDAIALFKIAS
ncbi:MAG TPA: methyl-accepting chemotaxis protein, partial [Paraburkholderia sp.]|nr:methyl-accepting chemotaxis protein [Paraburkholderia sp.]